MSLKNTAPWLCDDNGNELSIEKMPKAVIVPEKVVKAGGGKFTSMSFLNMHKNAAGDYAAAIEYAKKHGTPKDLEALSKFGRKYHAEINR